MHTKSVAKRQRNNSALAGNRIDLALRSTSDGQTMGIPVGPDTSLIIAELILSEIDTILHAKEPSLKGLRYIDDYEFAVDSHDAAENAIGSLQELLSDVELGLNVEKTGVSELPMPFEYVWASELRALPVRRTGQASDLIRLFDRAFGFAKQYPTHPILRYLMGQLKGFRALPGNWKLYQDLLLQCITVEPGTIASVVSNLMAHVQTGFQVDRQMIEPALNEAIERHSRFAHGNEIAWTLWALMTLGFRLSNESLTALAGCGKSSISHS